MSQKKIITQGQVRDEVYWGLEKTAGLDNGRHSEWFSDLVREAFEPLKDFRRMLTDLFEGGSGDIAPDILARLPYTLSNLVEQVETKLAEAAEFVCLTIGPITLERASFKNQEGHPPMQILGARLLPSDEKHTKNSPLGRLVLAYLRDYAGA